MQKELNDPLLESLLSIYNHGIADANAPLGHILILHDLGYLNNQDEEGRYIRSMHLTEKGLAALKLRCLR